MQPKAQSPVTGAKFIRLSTLAEKLGCGRSKLYKNLQIDPTFPRPKKFGGSTVWLEAEVENWMITAPSASFDQIAGPLGSKKPRSVITRHRGVKNNSTVKSAKRKSRRQK
jgi:predicted DNA-binding transcriptional regulator AlpA